jgi:hypothetical protein
MCWTDIHKMPHILSVLTPVYLMVNFGFFSEFCCSPSESISFRLCPYFQLISQMVEINIYDDSYRHIMRHDEVSTSLMK